MYVYDMGVGKIIKNGGSKDETKTDGTVFNGCSHGWIWRIRFCCEWNIRRGYVEYGINLYNNQSVFVYDF